MYFDQGGTLPRHPARQKTWSHASPLSKQFVVLANSYKKGHGALRCVAGREIVGNLDGDFVVEGWVRPMSHNEWNEGALAPHHFTFGNGAQATLLDVVQCDFLRPNGNAAQPENWLLNEDASWTKLGKVTPELLSSMIEDPVDLWIQPGEKTDRVAPDFLPAHSLRQSLLLIRIPRGFLSERNKGYRLAFHYKGASYDLAVTDPRITQAFVAEHGHLVRDAIACVSLTQPFQGYYQPKAYHYKIIATIFI